MKAESRGLITIPRLFAGAKEVFHIAYYHTPRAGYQDRISRSILEFKQGNEPHVSRWIGLAVELIGVDVRPDIILRRLDPEETRAERVTALDRLCETLAERCECMYDRQRLSKVRQTARLSEVAGRAARKKELEDAYVFDASGLAEDIRILVVDELAITGSTLEAITCAIKTQLPEAEVSCFVLGRSDSRVPNSHLDPAYFFSESPGESAFVKARVRPRGNPTPAGSLDDTVRMAVPVLHATASSSPVAGRRGRLKVAGLVVLFGLLLVGALAPIRTSKDAIASQEAIPMPSISADQQLSFEPPPTEQVVTAPPPVKRAGPTAVVTVPGAGLRRDHQITAKVIPGTTLKSGERVFIVKRFSSGAGPSWVQIRTKTGKTGWVFASLIHQR